MLREREHPARGLSARAAIALLAAAVVAGAAVAWLELVSDHRSAKAAWAVFAPAVGLSFVATGVYAWRARPENRTGALMVLLGFAWFVYALNAADGPVVWTVSQVTGGLWGAVFLHLGLTFPTGRARDATDRRIIAAGYAIFPLAFVPALLFSGPSSVDCGCNLLLVREDDTLRAVATAAGALLDVGLFAIVLWRATVHWRAASDFERLQLTPVYVCSLLTFLLVTIAQAGVGDVAFWAAYGFTALMPFAFLGGLLRSHVSHLDAELQTRLEELSASRARIVEAADTERRRLERDLHDGAQSRLVALALLLRTARGRAGADPELQGLLDRGIEELKTSLTELRELARGIHPAVLTERGLEPALYALATRAPVPVAIESVPDRRLPGAVESTIYFVVSEALANVAKYARATHASVRVEESSGWIHVEVADDGIGGADPRRGSGLRGLQDRVAVIEGRLSVDSPPGRGTRLRAELPFHERRFARAATAAV
jgi:signal transduction histidine kinase